MEGRRLYFSSWFGVTQSIKARKMWWEHDEVDILRPLPGKWGEWVRAQHEPSLFLNFVFLFRLQNLHYNYVSHLVQDCGAVLPTFQMGFSSIAEHLSDIPRGIPCRRWQIQSSREWRWASLQTVHIRHGTIERLKIKKERTVVGSLFHLLLCIDGSLFKKLFKWR